MPSPPVSRRFRVEEEGAAVKRTAAEIDRSKILADLRVKTANHEWLDQHREELRIRFGDKYVGVHEGTVIAADGDFSRLLSRLKRKLGDTDPSLAAVEFMSKEEFVWVLPSLLGPTSRARTAARSSSTGETGRVKSASRDL